MCNNGYFWMPQITFADVIKIFRFYLKKCKQKNAPKKKTFLHNISSRETVTRKCLTQKLGWIFWNFSK